VKPISRRQVTDDGDQVMQRPAQAVERRHHQRVAHLGELHGSDQLRPGVVLA